jgi:hypothetical protein
LLLVFFSSKDKRLALFAFALCLVLSFGGPKILLLAIQFGINVKTRGALKAHLHHVDWVRCGFNGIFHILAKAFDG